MNELSCTCTYGLGKDHRVTVIFAINGLDTAAREPPQASRRDYTGAAQATAQNESTARRNRPASPAYDSVLSESVERSMSSAS